jgi:hypothetical protein
MVLIEDIGHHNDVYISNLATLEHLRSRLNTKRHEPVSRHGEIRVVLACRKCNNEHGAKEQALLSKEELWERSKQHKTQFIKIGLFATQNGKCHGCGRQTHLKPTQIPHEDDLAVLNKHDGHLYCNRCNQEKANFKNAKRGNNVVF